jgi:hypothetical protein
LTQFKAYGVYVVPKVEVQVSGSFAACRADRAAGVATEQRRAGRVHGQQRLPEHQLDTRPGARRERTSVNLQLLEPYTVYLDRRNELDLRFGKVLRFAKQRRW